jgi:KDO2-lipid IV(A) lauroyltransferase
MVKVLRPLSGRALRRQFQYSLVFVLLLSFQLMPRGWGLGAVVVLSRLAWLLLPKERAKVLFNLRLIFPERTDHELLGREVFRQVGLNAVDAIRLPRLGGRQVEAMVEEHGLEHFDRAYRRGRGVAAVTGHIGCWELIPAWFAQRGYRINVIGRRVYDPRLDRLLNSARARWGVRVIDRDEGAREALRALRQGQALGILIDQDTRVASIEADFFGHKAKTPTGAAMLAKKTGAAVVPLAIHRLPSGSHRLTVLPELEPSADQDKAVQISKEVQDQTRAIEQLVRLDIVQWAWMHLRWTEKP